MAWGSIDASLVAGVVIFLVGLVIGCTYHMLIEEKELVLRFGSAYEDYRSRTPFLFPRLGRKRFSV